MAATERRKERIVEVPPGGSHNRGLGQGRRNWEQTEQQRECGREAEEHSASETLAAEFLERRDGQQGQMFHSQGNKGWVSLIDGVMTAKSSFSFLKTSGRF